MNGNVSPGNPVNNPSVKGVHTHSDFDLSRSILQTMRFAELTPLYAYEVTPKDTIPLRSSHDIRSYTLKAPLMSNITLKKDHFSVPLQAILPTNWEKVYKNPKQGDDVVATQVNCGCSLYYLLNYLQSAYVNLLSVVSDQVGETPALSDADFFSVFFRQMTIMEYFFSAGSVLRNLNYGFGAAYQNTSVDRDVKYKFDYIYDQAIASFLSYLSGKHFTVSFYGDGGNVCDVYVDLKESHGPYRLCFHDFLQRLRENPLIEFGSVTLSDSTSFYSELYTDILKDGYVDVPETEIPDFINLCPVAAYQMVAHHFYSNDNIDYIYSADLFRQLMSDYARGVNSGDLAYFTYNGVSTLYDYLSAYYINMAISLVDLTDVVDDLSSASLASYNYLSALFSFRRSLKYVDYFTGAKSQPLAVGDVDVAVNSNKVNVIDVSQNIQKQRFLNAVQRIPQKIKDYVKGIFNVDMGYDYHDPAWLGHTSDSVRVLENENTGDAQWSQAQSVTGLFRSNSERYAFEFTADRPGYVIGIAYFDIPRVYAHTTDRCWLHADRYDMFNPFMQFIGDQPISLLEVGKMTSNLPFAYTLRHMEYKQQYSYAAGGFADNLPGFSFTEVLDPLAAGVDHISPDFVRSRNGELDKFYLSLTGNSLASYFHFIVVSTYHVNAKRPMSYAPSIL